MTLDLVPDNDGVAPLTSAGHYHKSAGDLWPPACEAYHNDNDDYDTSEHAPHTGQSREPAYHGGATRLWR